MAGSTYGEQDLGPEQDGEDMLTPEEHLLLYARNGDVKGISDLLDKRDRKQITLDINCKGIKMVL